MKPWFLGRYSKRLEDELQALENNGYEYRLDEAERSAGRIVIWIKYPIEGETHDLKAIYPDNYPFFPFEIIAQTFPSGKHMDPYHGLLCLLKNPMTNWRVEDTLASYLASQVANIAKAHKAPEDAADIEAHEAAQITAYFHYVEGAVVFTGNWEISQDFNSGLMVIGLEDGLDPNRMLRGAILDVQDEKRSSLASLADELRVRYGKEIYGRWVRLPQPPKSNNPADILNEAIAQWPSLREPKFQHGPDVIGVLMREEVRYNEYHENWVFIVRTKVPIAKGQVGIQAYLARAEQANIHAIQSRVPSLSPLAQKKILIVGLGSLGASFTWQMARAGINTLHLIDHDHVQLGNIPRWLLGWQAIGYSKAKILAQYLRREYPFTQVKAWSHRLGAAKQSPDQTTDLDILPQALDGVDLIVDATAEWCVSHFLSDIAKQRGIPYIWLTGTPGGWGGVVGRILPNQTKGCWKCFQNYLNDGTIKRPSQANTPDIQPVGCFHPTFTGTGFDMDHISLAAARLAASTLCSGEQGGYPDFEWDVGVLDLWKGETAPIAPSWQTYKLDKFTGCDCQ